MYESKVTPGKKFGNGFQGKHYDEMHAKPSEAAHEVAETPEFEAGEQEGAKEGGDVHPVAAQHGPATEVHTMHDHANNKHHVHSKHADGHENHSDHQSAEEAHEEGGKLAGISVKRENEEKGEEDGQQGSHSAEDGFEMPPLV
jgi:hypothetical protein